MGVQKKIYAEFTSTSLMVSETTRVEVKKRDIKKIEIPETAYILRFFDIIVMNFLNKGKKIKTESAPINYSPRYYIGTEVCTRKQIANEINKEKPLDEFSQAGKEMLLRKMEVHKQKYALRVRVGGFIDLDKGDLVLLLKDKERRVVQVR